MPRSPHTPTTCLCGRRRPESPKAAIADIEGAVDRIGLEQLEAPYALLLRDRRVLTADFLVHLAVHLGYHLGQVDYHRRLVTKDPRVVDALANQELPTYAEPAT